MDSDNVISSSLVRLHVSLCVTSHNERPDLCLSSAYSWYNSFIYKIRNGCFEELNINIWPKNSLQITYLDMLMYDNNDWFQFFWPLCSDFSQSCKIKYMYYCLDIYLVHRKDRQRNCFIVKHWTNLKMFRFIYHIVVFVSVLCKVNIATTSEAELNQTSLETRVANLEKTIGQMVSAQDNKVILFKPGRECIFCIAKYE